MIAFSVYVSTIILTSFVMRFLVASPTTPLTFAEPTTVSKDNKEHDQAVFRTIQTPARIVSASFLRDLSTEAVSDPIDVLPPSPARARAMRPHNQNAAQPVSRSIYDPSLTQNTDSPSCSPTAVPTNWPTMIFGTMALNTQVTVQITQVKP
jgi:hypothetical protein